MGGLTLDLRPGAGLGAFNLGKKEGFAGVWVSGSKFEKGFVGFVVGGVDLGGGGLREWVFGSRVTADFVAW